VAARQADTVGALPPTAEDQTQLGPQCPSCGKESLRGTNLPGRYRCVYCLRRFELRSECPNCGMHSTIARVMDTRNITCNQCGSSLLRQV
jgi:DNA-directed RNA polymerase subunit RPC12/RpoP